MRRQFPYLLGGLLILIAPLSVSSADEAEPLKYVRVGLAALIVLIGLIQGKLRLGPASRTALLFVVFYVVAGLWSGNPRNAILYKQCFAASVLAGMVIANSSAAPADALRGINLLSNIALFTSLVALVVFWRNPQGNMALDRMSLAGINANTIGQTAAPLVVLALFSTLYSDRRNKRLCGLAATGLLLLIILYTGSRGAMLMAMIGGLTLLFGARQAQLRHQLPILIALMVLLVSVVLLLEVPALYRFGSEIAADSRSGVWRWAVRLHFRSPLVGLGWHTLSGRSTTNFQSMILQVLVETGYVGLVLFLGVGLTILGRCVRIGSESKSSGLRPMAFLATAIICGVVAHGMFESSLLMGSTLNSLLFGFAVGLLDVLDRWNRVVLKRRILERELRRQRIEAVACADREVLLNVNH